MKYILIFTIFSLSLISLNGYAVSEELLPTTELQTIQIYGNAKSNTLALGHQFFTRQDFIGKYQNISELLDVTPGVQVRRSSAGNPPNISIRGSTHRQITFIVDGQVINNAQSGGFNINLIPIQQIESIEIVQSGNSGNVQAIGGVISITTISASTQNSISLTTGSFDHREFGATISGRPNGELALSMNHSFNNGEYHYPVPSPFDNPNDKNRTEELKNNEYEKKSALLKWNKNLSTDLSIDFKTQYIESDKGIPNYQMNANKNTANLYEKKLSYGTGLNWKVSNTVSSKTRLGYSESDEIYKDLDGDLSYRPTYNLYTSSNKFLSEELILTSGYSTYNLSFNTNYEDYSENITLIPTSIKCKSGVSICDSIAEQTESSIAALYSYSGIDFDTSIYIKNIWINRNQDNRIGLSDKSTNNQQHHSWAISYKDYSWPMGHIRFDVNKSLRLPTLYELFGDRGLLKGNPSILPESSLSTSLEWVMTNAQINKIGISSSTSFYFKDISDAIVPIYSGSVGSYSNTSSAKIIGWQGNVSLITNNLTLLFQSTIQDSYTSSSIKSFDQKKLAGVFHEKFTTSIYYNVSETTNLSISHQIESGLYIDMANLNPSVRNKTTNLNISQMFNETSINVSANNIFNNEYFDQNNRPAIDRSFYINLQHPF